VIRKFIQFYIYSKIIKFNDNVSRLIFLSDRQALIKLNKQSDEIVERVKSRNWSFVYHVFRLGE
jgi:hypothetical protein